ncbi:MAG TPA: YciI-like protein [Terriglobales bacterium]|nr:YciI-like protein [Terriglobales bacterium]
MHYLLFYEVGEDYLSRRREFRQEHLEKAWKASARGELVLGGALADPVDRALLLFKGSTPEVAERFARADPYVSNGLVKRWYVREWTTVAGADAATPIPPGIGTDPEPEERAVETSGEGKGVILRLWKARSSAERGEEYVQYVTTKVFPALWAIEGHRGAYLLRRMLDGATELLVLTLWQSMEAVRRFAGVHAEKAVVEPEARAMLTSFDASVTHFEVVHGPERRLGK